MTPERRLFRERTTFERDASYPLGTDPAVDLGRGDASAAYARARADARARRDLDVESF